MPTDKSRNTEKEHQLKYIRYEEGKINILPERKRERMRNKAVKKLKNSVQQNK
jgi:hypothetical protein